MDKARRFRRVLALTSTNSEHALTWHLRVECMLPRLRELGFEVDTVTLPLDPAETWRLLESRRDYDIVWIHRRTFWNSEVRQLRAVARHLVLDIDDPVHLSSSRFFNFSLSRWLRFRATTRACAAVLAASAGLVMDAQRYNANVHLVPLCADPDAYSMRGRPRQPHEPLRLVWLGSRSTFKYLEGARAHLDQVGQLCRGVELTVVGHSTLKLTHLPVRNIAWSPQADREALDRCHVGLVPMHDDRWTRSKAALKPLQYLASGMPFLGHPVGVLNHLADGGRNGLLANTPQEWAQAVYRLQNDEELRQRMGALGVEYIRRYHSPKVLAERIAEAFSRIITPTGIESSAAA